MLFSLVDKFDSMYAKNVLGKKVQVGKDQEKVQSEKGAIRKRFPLQKPRWEKTKPKNQVLIPRKHFVIRMSSYFPNRWPPEYQKPYVPKFVTLHIICLLRYNHDG